MNPARKILPFLLVLLVTNCATVDPVVTPLAESAPCETMEPAAVTDPVAAPTVQSVPATVAEIDQYAPPAAGLIAPRADIWTRMRQDFRLPGADKPVVSKAIKKYSRSPQHVEGMFQRADPYIAYILDEVQKRGYPTEIALLPFVESGFDPYAYSHGRAAGLWQFIPGTGRMYGLKQDWWYDERRDIIASTEAAMNYLGKLQDEFEGDWLLSLAAYNSGSRTVRVAIKKNRKAGKPVDFWHLKLPKETRVYVPRLLAIAAIVSRPDEYGITLPPLALEPAFTEVDTGSQLDIGVAADLAGVNTDILYNLNPGFNRWATHPDGPHRLLVPAAHAETFIGNLDALPTDKRIKWVRHRIRKGETLSHIAGKYDTTVTILRKTNKLSGSNIRAGGHLLVPVAARDASQYAALDRRMGATGGRGSKTTYKVRNGDSLWHIAKKHQVSVKQVARWNQLGTGTVIRPGQKLVIWTKGAGSHGKNRLRSIMYTVRSGDSLYLIAKKYSVSITDLRRWNDLEENKYLQPGQRLTLYVDVTQLSSS